jgi:multicomponent Na+:H+ antiporter subunit D
MLAATAAVVLVGVALTVAAGPLYGLAGRAADDLGHPARYVTAVLGQP